MRLQGLATQLLARALWRFGQTEAAMASAREAVDLLRPLGSSVELAGALRQAGHLTMLRRRHAQALAFVREAGEVARPWARRPRPRSIRAQLIEGTVELVTGDADRGIELLLDAAGGATSSATDGSAATCSACSDPAGGEAKRYAAAQGWLTESVAYDEARDDDYSAAYARSWQARIRFEQGRWDEALATVDLVDRQAASIRRRSAASRPRHVGSAAGPPRRPGRAGDARRGHCHHRARAAAPLAGAVRDGGTAVVAGRFGR